VNGRTYDVLADEDEVVLGVLSLLRDIERGGGKLKNLVDLFRILDALDARQDWEAFLDARKRERTLGPTVNVLRLCFLLAGGVGGIPNLRSALGRYAAYDVPARLTPHPFVLAPARFSLGNKIWSARVHETSLPAWLAWWALSLPFRVAVRNQRRRPAVGAPRGAAHR